MNKKISVKHAVIGEGQPKICVPLVGRTIGELVEEAKQLVSVKPDLVEWRVDYFNDFDDAASVIATLKILRSALDGFPLLFTFRSAEEGGESSLALEDYIHLNEEAIRSGMVDLIDVELLKGREAVGRICSTAGSSGVYTVVSNHDFEKTPSEEVIIGLLERALEFGGDIPKVAVMPEGTLDVLTLMKATFRMKMMHPEVPIITMSMSGKGVISRLGGEIFGSDVTFASAGKASAPGQLPAGEMKQVLALIHDAQ